MEEYGRRLEVGTDPFCREIHLENPAQPRFENRERPATVSAVRAHGQCNCVTTLTSPAKTTLPKRPGGMQLCHTALSS
uniref:Uncharacterized protein n=1 Tax=Candidatus Kentrum sp. TUN TaxID=2126343 RepID=A0A450ZY69_9GAMM|nr:MAG: hypothetical protein BECKTUN1418F_GA0071002_11516 [Candidatus Kentron sp. TUN]